MANTTGIHNYPCDPHHNYDSGTVESAFRAVKTSDQQIPPFSAFRLLTFDAVDFDLKDEYYPTISAFIPKRDGVYLINSHLIFLPDLIETGTVIAFITLDGGNTSTQITVATAPNGFGTALDLNAILQLNAGDTVQIYAFSSITGVFQSNVCEFSAARYPSPTRTRHGFGEPKACLSGDEITAMLNRNANR